MGRFYGIQEDWNLHLSDSRNHTPTCVGIYYACHEQDTSLVLTSVLAIQEDLEGGSLGFCLGLHDEKPRIPLAEVYYTDPE